MSVRSEFKKMWRIMSDPAYRAFRKNFKEFRAVHGRETPSEFMHLAKGDVVLDIGGFVGDWAATITSKYPVTVHVFEPHPRFAKDLEARFAAREDVLAHDFAIGSQDGELALSDDDNASSALVAQDQVVKGRQRAVLPVFEELGLEKIAVAKINIEGGEYDLLPALVDAGLIGKIDRILVQFHQYGPEDQGRRDAIRDALSQTHTCCWSYPFIWELWELKSEAAA